MSRSRYRPRWSRRHERIGAPARDLRRDEVEERGYVKCDFVPLYGHRPRPKPPKARSPIANGLSPEETLAAFEKLISIGWKRGAVREVTIDYPGRR